MNEATIIWRRVDTAGHETAKVYADDEGFYLDGAAIFIYDGKPCRLEYLIECDTEWRTMAASVDGWVGDEMVECEIEVGDGSGWSLNGEKISRVYKCIDIDLNFSPVTNTLPIRRLDLEIGQSAPVRSAWLRFPSFELQPLEQTYTRIDETTVEYESATGFTATLTVNEAGLVTDYPGIWTVEK